MQNLKKINDNDVKDFFKDRTVAAILIRSMKESKPDIRKTLELMKLTKKNSCGLYVDNAITKGMLRKAKDYITFGTVDAKTVENLIKKKNPVQLNKKGKYYISNIFNLAPPVGGFERKGIKKTFVVGGVLGNRKDQMPKLIEKMLLL